LHTRWLHVNPTAVGFSFLLTILLISCVWGLRYSLFAAIVAAVAQLFLCHPVPVHDCGSSKLIALFAFLVTAVVASQLSERPAEECWPRTSAVKVKDYIPSVNSCG
jgi:K+-sensing histidine kinase KdpD